MALKYSITHNGNTWNSSTNVSSISLSNGSVTDSITSAQTRVLHCAGKYMPNNLVIGAKTLNCAGKVMKGDVSIVAETAEIVINDLTGTRWNYTSFVAPSTAYDITIGNPFGFTGSAITLPLSTADLGQFSAYYGTVTPFYALWTAQNPTAGNVMAGGFAMLGGAGLLSDINNPRSYQQTGSVTILVKGGNDVKNSAAIKWFKEHLTFVS